MRTPRPLHVLILTATILASSGPAQAADRVTLRRDGQQLQVDGRMLVKAEDGGLLLLARDGVLWRVSPEDLVKHTTDDRTLEPLSTEDLARRTLAALPEGFEVITTAHYLVCYNTSRGYAQWCASLLERLYRAFTNYWSLKGFDLREPEMPLVAIVFADRQSYIKHAQAEVGDSARSIIAYFHLETNRITMYDLTGSESSGRSAERATSALINRILAQPDAERTVATIVHEATHQIAFNCGLHTRLSDCPLWFSEGIATYFETPDLTSAKGWRKLGEVNQGRLSQFHSYLNRRPAGSLATLIADDKRFRDPRQHLDAYAEAWALTYYLIQHHRKQYAAYLQLLSRKKPLLWDDSATRLDEFKQAFGADLDRLDAEFVRYIKRVR